VKTTPPQWIVTSEEQGLRLDRFLAAPGRLGSRGRVKVALERGQVFVNDAEASAKDAGASVKPGDVVRLWIDRPGSSRRRSGFESRGLRILYEDETLLVVNKPAGLLTVPLGRRQGAPSAYSLIADHLGPRRCRTPFVVHRIDRDTSGIVVFAKTTAAQRAIKEQFARRDPERVYWAVVRGRPMPAQGRWRDRLVWDDSTLKQTAANAKDPGATEAISDYRVLETFGDCSLVEVRLHTGKRNQIRIQAALRGHPLIGERQYAKAGNSFPRQALHAYRLSFAHPVDGRQLTFEAPLPQDLVELRRRLRARGHRGREGSSH
jgi:23S rRNA pseudouridine1911/1915/1917 synthase